MTQFDPDPHPCYIEARRRVAEAVDELIRDPRHLEVFRERIRPFGEQGAAWEEKPQAEAWPCAWLYREFSVEGWQGETPNETVWQPQGNFDEKRMAWYYIILAAIHDHELETCIRITDGVWPPLFVNGVWQALRGWKGERTSVVQRALEWVRTDLNSGRAAPEERPKHPAGMNQKSSRANRGSDIADQTAPPRILRTRKEKDSDVMRY